MNVQEIATAMTGQLNSVGAGRHEAYLPSPVEQNHAAFLAQDDDGAIMCVWFGGSLEGKSDISIRASVLLPNSKAWGAVSTLSNDPDHSEQNPVLFKDQEGQWYLFHTSQPDGNQDQCRMRMVKIARDGDKLATQDEGQFVDLPLGCFIRAPLQILDDGRWLLPIFRCVQREGQKWTGSHDVAAYAVSADGGQSWDYSEIDGSVGCVHMCAVTHEGGMSAFYRRRQADMVHRAHSDDGGLNWSVPAPTDVPNNNSSIAVTKLASGALAMICNPVNGEMSSSRRASLYDELGGNDKRPDADPAGGCTPIWGVERAPVIVAVSHDGGVSFPDRYLIEDGEGTCLSNNSTDGKNKEMSYPWILEAQDGALHLAYTYHRRGIKHVKLDKGWQESMQRL